MMTDKLPDWLNQASFLDTLIPDFTLGFTFFTALSYATLGRLFGRQKPAVAMSVSMGLALAVGLVWWERDRSWSIRSLGPVAIGFALILLVTVVYHAIKRQGGSWAGVALGIGICILVAGTIGVRSSAAGDVLQAAAFVALIVGLLAFLFHHRTAGSRAYALAPPSKTEIDDVRHDLVDVDRGRRLGRELKRRFRTMRRGSFQLVDRPEERTDVMLQLRRMLPAEGWLTERMARLRKKSHHIRNGHIARLEETKHLCAKLPVSERKRLAADLVSRYREQVGIDERLERLDRAAAETERRIRSLTVEAHQVVARYEFRRIEDILRAAEKLQDHNIKLCRRIEHTEQKLIRIARQIAKKAGEVNAA